MYIYIFFKTVERGYAEKETTMAEERWCKAPGKVVLTFIETNTIFGLHWPEEPRVAHWPQIK
jgi:hypothetical protein